MADTDPIMFTAAAGERIAKTVKTVEDMPRKQVGRERRYYEGGEPETCWGILGNEVSPGLWEWSEYYRHTDDIWQLTDPGNNGDDDRPDPYKNLACTMSQLAQPDAYFGLGGGGWRTGDLVLLRRADELIVGGDSDGQYKTVWRIITPPPNVLVFVAVGPDNDDVGAAAGDEASQATYTYTVTRFTATTPGPGDPAPLLTGASPMMERPYGKMSPAGIGLAFIDADETAPRWNLVWVNEVPDNSGGLPDGTYPCGSDGFITLVNGKITAIS